MKLSEIEKRIPLWYAASVQPKGPSWMLLGGPGRGKTSMIEQAPAMLAARTPDKKFGLVVINGACFTLTKATGYLWPVEVDGKQYSRFTRPDWWVTQEGKPLEAYDGGIIFVDEADKLGADEKKIMGEAALSKRLASHDLPPGWVVWFAGNRSQDRSGSTKEFDHLINRRNQITVDDDLESLVRWMEKNSCLPETIIFAHENPNIVFPDKLPDVQGPFCTPRSLASADAWLRLLMTEAKTSVIPTDATTTEELAAGIGAGAAAQLIAAIRLGQELPSFEQIIAAPTTVKTPTRPDAQMLASYKLAARASKATIEAVLKYVDRLPKEFAVIFARAATTRDKSLINHPAVIKWCGTNAALVATLGRLQ